MIKQPDPQPVSRAVCHKLECLEDFLKSYASGGAAYNYCYLELFARPGLYKCRESGTLVPDLSYRALRVNPGFGRYVLALTEGELREEFTGIDMLTVTGNILHDSTRRQIFDHIPRSSSILCIIEPPGYRRLRWSTVKKIITGGRNWQGQRMDMLMILPLENALFKNISRADCTASINRFFGTTDWQSISRDLAEGQISPLKARLEMINLYAENLKNQGYRHVEVFNPAKPGRIPPYFLIWSSDSDSRIKALKSIWQKPRFLPGELFHQPL